MNKNLLGITILVLLVLVGLLLLTGTRISCYPSFWDKDKQVVEIKHD